MDERTFWGVVALAVSFTVLVLGVLYAAAGARAGEDEPPPPLWVESEETYSYTCYCHRDPVHITVRTRQIPRIFGRGRWLP
ncbi:hypothetical protein [Streptomyces sp. NPDC093109]|uniref:hypothetical protein n=1 Tax=Streptomyces sp. NPDC093109 TaxID=3154977 RepID=UPI00344BBB5E